MASDKNVAASAGSETAKRVDEAARDSPKRHGDKFGASGNAGAAQDGTEDAPRSGDSPKRQGDPLKRTIEGDPNR